MSGDLRSASSAIGARTRFFVFDKPQMFVNKHFGTANPVDLEVDVLFFVLTSGMFIKLL